MKHKIFLFFSLLFLAGCYKNHLFVMTEGIDRNYLASTHVDAPDPRRKDPPKGQKIIVAWDFPLSIYKRGLFISLTVRFWNNDQKEFFEELDRKKGVTSFFFPYKSGKKENKVLTYLVEVISEDRQIVETWEHQLWVELIDVDQEIETGKDSDFFNLTEKMTR